MSRSRPAQDTVRLPTFAREKLPLTTRAARATPRLRAAGPQMTGAPSPAITAPAPLARALASVPPGLTAHPPTAARSLIVQIGANVRTA